MHYGRIDQDTKAAAVYRALRDKRGQWVDGWQLSQEAQVTAVSTRVSEVRHQLPADECIEQTDALDGKRGSWYRLVHAGGASTGL